MFGIVHGPYTRKNGQVVVVVFYYDEKCDFVRREYLGYQKYVKEYNDGKHRYCSPPDKNKLLIQSGCAFCRKEPDDISKCCSVCCLNQLKIKKITTIVYDQQIVVNIKGRESENSYVILYELTPGNKETLFIPTKKCKTVVSADENSVRRFRIEYDRKDACRIRPVVGYKKYFWITETGVLVSKRTKKVLSNYLTDRGYLYHATKIGGRKGLNKAFKIHRLVAMAFIPNPENKSDVNHKNGIKTDNNVNNLEWLTNLENIAHAVSTKLQKPLYGEQLSHACFTNKQADSIRRYFRDNPNDISIREFSRIMNISRKACMGVLSGKTYIR
jgi:hypothetical protein